MSAKLDGSRTLVLVTREGMGDAEPELSRKLFATWTRLVLENDSLPGAICFYAKGVRMVAEGSPVLETLKAFEAKGVRLIVCSTCLNFYGLVDRVKVGIVGGMGDILAAQWKAEKVIAL